MVEHRVRFGMKIPPLSPLRRRYRYQDSTDCTACAAALRWRPAVLIDRPAHVHLLVLFLPNENLKGKGGMHPGRKQDEMNLNLIIPELSQSLPLSRRFRISVEGRSLVRFCAQSHYGVLFIGERGGRGPELCSSSRLTCAVVVRDRWGCSLSFSTVMNGTRAVFAPVQMRKHPR